MMNQKATRHLACRLRSLIIRGTVCPAKNATFPGFLSSNHIELDACQLRYANVRKDLFLLNLRLTAAAALLLTCIAFTASGCGNPSSVEVGQGETGGAPAAQNPGDPPAAAPFQPDDTVKQGGSSETGGAAKEPTKPPANLPPSGKGDDSSIRVIANPEDVAVLVNKTNKLPENYNPKDLVEPNVPFIFKEKSEKRMLRKEAASALEDLFDAAKKDGLPLAGVSGYRSHATQKTLYNNYVKRDGEAAANKYSAKPGHSEHETGLAIDVTGSSGKCPAQDCFGDTKEAKWLAEHAQEYGFIIRYPKGKESITGYQYEPWHLRYVGKNAAKEIAKQGITLEEYTHGGVPVSNPK